MRGLFSSSLFLAAGLAISPAYSAPVFWINPATGDWFDAANWSSSQPSAADDAFVNNGGSAQASGAVTPAMRQLHIGAGTGAAPTGTVETSALDLEVSQTLRVGVAQQSGATADGVLTADGDVTAPGRGAFQQFTIGEVAASDGAASGSVQVTGNITAAAGHVGVIGSGDGGEPRAI